MNCQKKYIPDKLLNPYFIYTWIVAFTLQIGQNIYNTTMSVYAVSLGYSNTFAGRLAIPYLICAITGRILSGFISDHTSRRLAMVIGCGAFLLGSVVFNIPSLAAIPFFMLLARGIHGFGYACGNTAYSVAAVDVTPVNRLGIGVGLNWTAQGIAQAAGGVLVTVLVTNGNYGKVFLAATISLLTAEIFSLLCSYEGKNTSHQEYEKISAKSLFNSLFECSALPHALITLVYYLGVAGCALFALTLAESRGIPHGGMFYTASAVSMTLCNIFLVRLQKKFGSSRVLLPVFVLMALTNLILSECSNFSLFLLAGFLYGAGIGMMPVMQNAVVRHLPVLRRGAGTSTLFLAMDLAMGFGPVIWGMVSDKSGFQTVFRMSAVCTLTAMVLMILVFYRESSKEKI